ncbi:MAG: PilZ domain-containing protein [Vulcanimicrobiaceae bacterium]
MSDRQASDTPSDDEVNAVVDKRYSVRLHKYIDIIVEDALSAMLFRGAIADISPTGMRAMVDQYLPVGTKYTFTMKRNPMLTLRGQIRWIRSFSGDTFQIGVQFLDLTSEQRKRIETFIEIERRRLTTNG